MRSLRAWVSVRLSVVLLLVGLSILGTVSGVWGYGSVPGEGGGGSSGFFAEEGSESSVAAVGYVAVSAGGRHSCALRADGSVVCWGDNGYGQAVAPAGAFVAVSAGERHSCGILRRNFRGGSVVCWGSGARRQALAAILSDSMNVDTTRIVIERRETGQDTQERRQIAAAIRAGNAPAALSYQHLPGYDEPLLWVADAVAWSYGAQGNWRSRVSDILEYVPRR